MPNRALLMGVTDYEADVISNLDFVSNDLDTLGTALTNVGYDITTLGGTGDRSPTHNTILTGVYEFCRHGVQQDEIALIYFSGHGLHYQGKDYLVPADATLGDELIEQVMVPLDFGAVYEQSPAAAIVFFIDACREGIELGEKSNLGYQQWSQGKLENVRRQQSAYIFACGPGEVSRFVPGQDGFSLFTRALSETLESRPEIALTFGRVRKEVQLRVNDLADKYQKKRQSIRVVSEGGVDDSELAGLQLAPTGFGKGPVSTGPAIDIDAIADYEISDEDLKLLSYGFNGEEPWVEGNISILHVLRASAALGRSIGSVLGRLEEFAPLGLRLPPVDVESHGEVILEQSDLILLPSVDGNRSTRVSDEISAVHVLYAANKLTASVDAVWQRIKKFEPFGVKVPEVDMTPLHGVMVDSRDLTMLSTRLTGVPPWIRGEVSIIHLIRVAHILKEPIGPLLDRLAQFEACGISLPKGIQPSARDLMISDKDIRFLSEDMDGEAPWVNSPMPVGHILCAAKEEGMSVGEVLAHLRRFESVGIKLPPISEEETVNLKVESRDLLAVSEDFDGVSPWLEKVPAARLIVMAHHDEESVGRIVERLKGYEATGLRLPEVDEEAAADLFVSRDDLMLLFGDQDGEEWLSETIPIAHILFAANRLKITVGEALERMRQFKALGLNIPAVDPEKVKALRVEDTDLVLLSISLDGFEPWLEEIDWFHLLRATERLNESLEGVLERLRKFEPAGYRAPRPQGGTIKDIDVSGTDLVLLSRDLDGHSPWIGDHPVGIVHLLRSSAKLEEPVGMILERLRRFAPIGIVLPSVDSDEVRDLQVVDEDLLILSRNLDGAAPWVKSRISVGHVLAAAHTRGESIGQIIERLRRFEGLGFLLPKIPDQAKAMRVAEQDLILLSEDLDARAPWMEGTMSIIHLLRAANRLGEQVGNTLLRLQKLETLKAVRLTSVFAEPYGSLQRRLRRSV